MIFIKLGLLRDFFLTRYLSQIRLPDAREDPDVVLLQHDPSQVGSCDVGGGYSAVLRGLQSGDILLPWMGGNTYRYRGWCLLDSISDSFPDGYMFTFPY